MHRPLRTGKRVVDKNRNRFDPDDLLVIDGVIDAEYRILLQLLLQQTDPPLGFAQLHVLAGGRPQLDPMLDVGGPESSSSGATR